MQRQDMARELDVLARILNDLLPQEVSIRTFGGSASGCVWQIEWSAEIN